MEHFIAAFPQNISDAVAIAKKNNFEKPNRDIKNILICGMGGSGIGGKITSLWMSDYSAIPVQILNDYNLPNWVNENTLVIGSSYSGGTEETTMSVYKAHEKGAYIIGICSGGDLESFCRSNNYPVVIVPGGNPPRSQLAFSLIQLVNIFSQLGYMNPASIDQLLSAKALIEDKKAEIDSEARRIASFMDGKVGVIYSSAPYEGVAIRARQQFEENSKYLCWHHVIPEMNHNELVGWGGGDDRFAVLFIQSNDMIERNQRRYDITMDVIKKKTKHVTEIKAQGNNMIERSIYLINLIDWASWYLSDIKKVDAIEIDIIAYLKGELSKL
jgi:glucose/mannose-6-phosphate isomerase